MFAVFSVLAVAVVVLLVVGLVLALVIRIISGSGPHDLPETSIDDFQASVNMGSNDPPVF